MQVLITVSKQSQEGTQFHPDSAWKRFILVLLENCMYRCVDSFQKAVCMTYTTGECTVNKLLMMDRGTVRNMKSFMTK